MPILSFDFEKKKTNVNWETEVDSRDSPEFEF